MKSLVHEATSIAKAIDQAWHIAGCPERFTVKILEQPERNFFGFTTRSAKVALLYEETPAPHQRDQRGGRDQRAPRTNTREPRHNEQHRTEQPQTPRHDDRQQRPHQRQAMPRREDDMRGAREQRTSENVEHPRYTRDTREQRFERPEREQRVERTPRPERTERAESHDEPRPVRERTERTERPERPTRDQRFDRSERTPRHERIDRSELSPVVEERAAAPEARQESVSPYTPERTAAPVATPVVETPAAPAPAPRPAIGDALWNADSIRFAQTWLRDTLATMGHDRPVETYTMTQDGTTLIIQLPFHVFEEQARERQLFHSLGILMLESLKKEFRKQFRGHKVVITYAGSAA